MPQIEEVLSNVKTNALASLAAAQRQTTNLHLDTQIYAAGTRLGPAIQNLVVDAPSILVFADDDPRANFGHNCRYLLHDPNTGALRRTLAARFPPYGLKPPATMTVFHEPIVRAKPALIKLPFPRPIPIWFPDGNRYAILYSGMSDTRHLNDLEFCYRTLVDKYLFPPANIFVLNYDGTLNTKDGAPGLWPGDNTAYRIKVTGKGNRAAFQAAFNSLKAKIKADDLLFIHTNNHGDNSGGQSYLCQYPDWSTYWANDFCTDLAVLPKFKSLLVMMEQCNSGGFNAPVIAHSPATATSIASAAIASQSSYSSADGNWDCFAFDWIAAQAGHYPNGGALSFNPDTNADGAIQASEAYHYANTVDVGNGDTPNYSQGSAAGGNITLDQQYELYWLWTYVWLPVLAKFGPLPPDPGPLAAILPELQKIAKPILEQAAGNAASSLAPKLTEALQKAIPAHV